jgi:hypothetical protein
MDFKKEIIKIMVDAQEKVKMGSDGDYSQEVAVLADDYDDVAGKIYEGLIKKLQHHRDTTIGLYATDKEIGKLLHLFWQSSSDACPLECGEAEKQEIEFEKWVKGISFRID